MNDGSKNRSLNPVSKNQGGSQFAQSSWWWPFSNQIFSSFLTWYRAFLWNLIQYTVLSPSMCCLCFKGEETLDHIFLHCLFTRKAWNTLFRIFYLELCLPSKVDSWLIEGLNIRGYSLKRNMLWRCATRSLLWYIWKERNRRIF